MKYFNKLVSVMSVYALLFTMVFGLASVQTVQAKGSTGEYAGRVSDSYTFQNTNSSFVLDQAGTRWNLVDDVYLRSVKRTESVDFNAQVTISSAGAWSLSYGSYELWPSSGSYGKDRIANYYGWTICVPTATVASDRVKVRLYNPITNTQRIYINVATGTVSSLLYYPSTGTFINDIDPGESYELEVSSNVHPIAMSSGTFSTEKLQVTQCK